MSIRLAAPACTTGRESPAYGIDLTVISDDIDPTFAFMTVDWDGRIRMDPSSVYAMQRLIALKIDLMSDSLATRTMTAMES